jgi:DNA-binding NtrC family response regulator
MADGQPRRILIVDDDTALLDVLQRAFQNAGVEVVAHSTFEGARRALHDGNFDALLTDVRLGAFNGLQLAVISRDAHPDIRVIVFSGFDDPVLRSEAERVRAVYVVKPVSTETLLELVRRPQSS